MASILHETFADDSHRWLSAYSKFVVCAVFALIFKGALVTSHNAGLAVPDWPTTFGQNMFLYPYRSWIGGIFFEHSHRLLASIIGALTVILAAWLKVSRSGSVAQKLGYFAIFTVIAQGMLGGLTVLLKLPDAISVAHGILGQTFLLITVTIAFLLSAEYSSILSVRNPQHRELALRISRYAAVLVGVLYIQLLLGAMTRHAEAGLAILDFPTTGGSLIPTFDAQMVAQSNALRGLRNMAPVSTYQAFCHALHRVWALVVVVTVGLVVAKARYANSELRFLKRNSLLVLYLVALQCALGVATVLGLRDPWVTSIHVLTGAALLGMSWLLILRSRAVGSA